MVYVTGKETLDVTSKENDMQINIEKTHLMTKSRSIDREVEGVKGPGSVFLGFDGPDK